MFVGLCVCGYVCSLFTWRVVERLGGNKEGECGVVFSVIVHEENLRDCQGFSDM